MTFRSFFLRNSTGLHYAVRILIGTTLLWLLLRKVGDTHPIWAMISLIIVTEPDVKIALETFRSRIYNTLIGCAVGLIFLFIAGPKDWVLPLALTATVFISIRFTRMEASWRIAPIAAVIVISSSLIGHSKTVGLQAALQRTGEVFLGGAVALLIAWLLSRIWMPLETPSETSPQG